MHFGVDCLFPLAVDEVFMLICNGTLDTSAMLFTQCPLLKCSVYFVSYACWIEHFNVVFQVTLVVNYDIPVKNTSNRHAYAEPDYETYLHRIGRSGRFGRKGEILHTLLLCICLGLDPIY